MVLIFRFCALANLGGAKNFRLGRGARSLPPFEAQINTQAVLFTNFLVRLYLLRAACCV